MHIKTILNRVPKFKSFAYEAVCRVEEALVPTLEVELYSHVRTAAWCIAAVTASGLATIRCRTDTETYLQRYAKTIREDESTRRPQEPRIFWIDSTS